MSESSTIIPTKDRFKLVPAVYLILINENNEVLLHQRKNSGYMDGMYSMVAGHLDGGEPARIGMIREAKEEAGIDIEPEDLQVTCTMHRMSTDSERVDFFMVCRKWRGEVCNTEPHKCSDLRFFPVDKLPENTIPYVKQAIYNSFNGITFCEVDWENR